MREVIVTVALLSLTAAACTRTSDVSKALGSSPTRGNVPSSTQVSSAAGSVTRGIASVSVTGALEATASYLRLSSPATCSTPPGRVALQWLGGDGLSLVLGGSSFSGRRSTSSALTLGFDVETGGRVVSFLSTEGECWVRIQRARSLVVAGTFQCTDLPDVGGSAKVDVSGRFSATG